MACASDFLAISNIFGNFQWFVAISSKFLANTAFPHIVSSPWIVSSSIEETIQVTYIRKNLMRKLYEIFKLLWIKKRIVAAPVIWGNTVGISGIGQQPVLTS